MSFCVATLLWEECEDETHTPKMRTQESSETPESLKFDCKGQNTLHWGVVYIIEKPWKCKCRKWARLSHLDIWNTSYGQKKGRESNWQFDFRPLKVKNRPNHEACKSSGRDHWKALNKSYNFSSDLVLIWGLSKELWPRKVAGVQTLVVSGLLLGSPRTKSHLDVGAVRRRREYYMREGGGFPWVQAMMSFVSPGLPVACPGTKSAPESELTNLLVGLMQVRVSN
jgi:hypothetical protein